MAAKNDVDQLAYAVEHAGDGDTEMVTMGPEAGEDGKEEAPVQPPQHEPHPMRVTSDSDNGLLKEEELSPQNDNIGPTKRDSNYNDDDDDEDGGLVVENHAEDEYKNLIDTVVSRNWFLMFQFTLFGAFVGLIIYIISGNQDYIWYMGGTFCAIAFGIDTLTPKLSTYVRCYLHVNCTLYFHA